MNFGAGPKLAPGWYPRNFQTGTIELSQKKPRVISTVRQTPELLPKNRAFKKVEGVFFFCCKETFFVPVFGHVISSKH